MPVMTGTGTAVRAAVKPVAWVGGSALEGVLPDDVERPHAILPANLLALFVGAPVVADGHLEDAPAAARHLGGDLRLETEAVLFHGDGADDLGAEGLVAGLHVGEVQVARHVAQRGEQV